MSVLISLHISLYCDNKNVISTATNHAFHERTKRIEVNCHLTHLEYIVKKIALTYILSKEQVNDVFKKAQTIPQFCYFLSKLSVFDPP